MDYVGKIIKIYPNKGIDINVSLDNTDFLHEQSIVECEVRITDGRSISAKQRRMIYLLVHYITKFISDPPANHIKKEERSILNSFKLQYLIDITDDEEIRYMLTYNYCDLVGINLFSLSDVDMTTASDFINYLITFCIEYGVQTNIPLNELTNDLQRYTYACVANRKCVVCQAPNADIHHSMEKVGMGRDRNAIIHEGMHVQSLCRIHHTECHTMPQGDFDERYHVISIKLDKKLCSILGLKYEAH